MKKPSLFSHLRDILILPFSVTVIVPYLIYDSKREWNGNDILFKITGCVALLSGLTLFFYTVFLFHTIGKGTLAPWTPKQKLVISGPYKYCRNPMITGVLLILVGESLILQSSNILYWAGTFFIINTLYFVLVEEPMLLESFGDDYSRYRKAVNMWIPGLKPYTQSDEPNL